MTPTPKFAALLAACALSLLLGVALGRPELGAVGAAFAAVALRAWLSPAPRIGAVHVDVTPERLLEGDLVEVRVAIDAAEAARATAALAVPERMSAEVAAAGGAPDATALLSLRARRWGRTELGPLRVRVLDRGGLRCATATIAHPGAVRVLPARPRLDALLDAERTQARAGTQVSRERGEGSELAELRPLRAGDPRRRIAWRASARRGQLVVADRHADRNADVVLLLDTFAEAHRGAEGTLGVAVRAAAALAEGHLARMDRVAVIEAASAACCTGCRRRWAPPPPTGSWTRWSTTRSSRATRGRTSP